ncbi:hypothetical protein J6590_018235 [Homalodisca vitripennis]|nr:hypothetical protein J6590_018235 [Homalodisca vitripennis]
MFTIHLTQLTMKERVGRGGEPLLPCLCGVGPSKVQSPTSVAAPTTNPFLVSSPSAQPILDLFATPAPVTEQPVVCVQYLHHFVDIVQGAQLPVKFWYCKLN